MKRLISLSLAALMVLAVSCGKDNKPGNTGEPELIVPDVMSDLVIGEQTFPIKDIQCPPRTCRRRIQRPV